MKRIYGALLLCFTLLSSSCSLSEEKMIDKINILSDNGAIIDYQNAKYAVYHIGQTFYKLDNRKKSSPTLLLSPEMTVNIHELVYNVDINANSITPTDVRTGTWEQYLSNIDFTESAVVVNDASSLSANQIKLRVNKPWNAPNETGVYLSFYLEDPQTLYYTCEATPEVGVKGKVCKYVAYFALFDSSIGFPVLDCFSQVSLDESHTKINDFVKSTFVNVRDYSISGKSFPTYVLDNIDNGKQIFTEVKTEIDERQRQEEAARVRAERERQRQAQEAYNNEIIVCPSCHGRGWFPDRFTGSKVLCAVCGQTGYVRRGNVW